MRAQQVAGDLVHLLFGQDRGYSFLSLGAKGVNEPLRVFVEHLAAE